MTSDICAVIVTYNRLDRLKKALASYSVQKLLPKYMVVVNNASTDETSAFLDLWAKKPEGFQKIVITSEENLGGSGGFYLGQKKALELDANWVMIADDDAYPEPDYLLGMTTFLKGHDENAISIVCGKVVQNGTYLNEHRSYINNKWSISFYKRAEDTDYEKNEFYPDLVSYVGIIINKRKLLQVGLVNKDYFIWQDDNEHSFRLKKVGEIVCLPSYAMLHDCVEDHFEFSWKLYYGYRNRIDFMKHHFMLQFPFCIFLFTLKSLLCPLKGRPFQEVKLRLTAIKDGLLGNLGKHALYKPGWKP